METDGLVGHSSLIIFEFNTEHHYKTQNFFAESTFMNKPKI